MRAWPHTTSKSSGLGGGKRRRNFSDVAALRSWQDFCSGRPRNSAIPRCEVVKSEAVAATGIEGLDHILVGGFPRNHVYLLQGDPGVGKTTLGLQFLLEGVRNGETAMYITLSETRDELRAVARSHNWDIDAVHIYEQLIGE